MNRPTRRDALFLSVSMLGAAALAGAGRLALARRAAASPKSPPIDLEPLIPRRFPGWQEDEARKSLVRPPELQGKAYGLYDQVLERTYVDPDGLRVMLSMAFGGTQSHTLQLHRPEVCYEAAGFEVAEVRADTLSIDGRAIPVTRMRSFKPGRPEPVTYWTVLGDEVVAGRRGFKLGQVAAALTGRTLSGLLVRVSSIDEDTARAFALQQRFAEALGRALQPQGRALVLGRHDAG